MTHKRSHAGFLVGMVVLLLLEQAVAQGSKTFAASKSPAECGLISGGTLKCPRFGFNYKVPFGWVDRTAEMQPETAASTDGQAVKKEPITSSSETLLAIFERPPGASGETINSAVVIAAESLANYHGIKTASDYFGPITELAEQRGFKIVTEPQEFGIGTKHLVRGDFNKDRGKLTMWQGSLVMIEKGYIVSFTFVGGSVDEVESLIDNLSFGPRPSRTPEPVK